MFHLSITFLSFLCPHPIALIPCLAMNILASLSVSQREIAECTFTPSRVSAGRGDTYLQHTSHPLMSPADYKPYLLERKRKDDMLRSVAMSHGHTVRTL